jgi:hypothetical protein
MTVLKWRWRVSFSAGGPMEVTASSKAGAVRTGRMAAGIIGRQGNERKALRAECLGPVGTNHPAGLFDPPEETPAGLLDR